MTVLLIKGIFWFIRWPVMAALWYLVGANVMQLDYAWPPQRETLYPQTMGVLVVALLWTLLVTNLTVTF